MHEPIQLIMRTTPFTHNELIEPFKYLDDAKKALEAYQASNTSLTQKYILVEMILSSRTLK